MSSQRQEIPLNPVDKALLALDTKTERMTYHLVVTVLGDIEPAKLNHAICLTMLFGCCAAGISGGAALAPGRGCGLRIAGDVGLRVLFLGLCLGHLRRDVFYFAHGAYRRAALGCASAWAAYRPGRACSRTGCHAAEREWVCTAPPLSSSGLSRGPIGPPVRTLRHLARPCHEPQPSLPRRNGFRTAAKQ